MSRDINVKKWRKVMMIIGMARDIRVISDGKLPGQI
jgi:hypothetical protein